MPSPDAPDALDAPGPRDPVTALLRFVLDPARPPPAVDELRAWWDLVAPLRDRWTAPFDRALAGGACADRVGFAFAGGYAEALRVLVPGLPAGAITALCATEEAGNHPRAIKTRLAPAQPGRFELSGRKKWATVASAASSLLVIASTGEQGGRNQLRAVRVRVDAPGVRLHPSTSAFVPEIPHAEVELDRAVVTEADLLPGDGYEDYLKPFRTIEDVHVHGALLGYLIGVVRRAGFSRDLLERLVVLAIATRALADGDPRAATTHVALAGVIDLTHRLIAEIETHWAAAGGGEWSRWQRDRPLLRVAGTARAARRDRAWSLLDGSQIRQTIV